MAPGTATKRNTIGYWPLYYQAADYSGQVVRPPWPVLAPERVAAAIARPAGHVSVPQEGVHGHWPKPR